MPTHARTTLAATPPATPAPLPPPVLFVVLVIVVGARHLVSSLVFSVLDPAVSISPPLHDVRFAAQAVLLIL